MHLTADNFRYPSSEEWRKVDSTFPKITRFGFRYVSEIKVILYGSAPIKELLKYQNLHEWDMYLDTRISHLHTSYINTIVNFERGVVYEEDNYEDQIKVVNSLQFDYYLESAFFFLIAVRDCVFQMINIAHGLGLEEHKVCLNSLEKKVKKTSLESVIERISKFEANDLRNALTHRFSKFQPDRRSRIVQSEDGVKPTYSLGYLITMPPQEKVEHIKNAVNHLKEFTADVRKSFKDVSLEFDDVHY